ncbi:MAG TPA: ABC transporter permease [Gaiellaceae bacterium]|nr:ABC transporter permease [Gaiellaceae bacterium]
MATIAVRTSAFDRARSVTEWHAISYKRTWRATITTAFLNPIFFLLSVGVLLGKLIDDDQAALGGLSYVEFVAPGLLAATAMQMGANDAMWPVMAGIKWLRTYHAVMATPVRVAELVLGTMGWAAIRVFSAAVIFTAVAAVGGAISSPLAILAPFAALLCGLAFNAPIAAFSAALEGGDDGWFPALNRFVLIPMFLFAGTFFPVSQLPDWLEPVAWATPLWHGVELCRMLTTGNVDALLAAVHVGYLSLFVVVGTVLAIRIHERALLK